MPDSDDKRHSLETRLVHAGDEEYRIEGALTTPIFQSSTFQSREEASYHDIRYARLSNTPTHHALHAKLASIESGEAALVTSSGMAAIATASLTYLEAGDHLLAQNVLYGGTFDLFTRDLPSLGIQIDYFDGDQPESWKGKLREETRVIYAEAITNPLMGVADHESIVAFARENDLVAMIDNTFASPINFRPLEIGYDVVLHSATKYLNGHTDLIAGAIIASHERVNEIRRKLNHFGASLDPHACYLLARGLKTLALRVRQQNATALELARALDGHDRVRRVYYPGLDCHHQHERAKRLFAGFGGMLGFDLHADLEETEAFLHRLSIPVQAPSLGGLETLVTRPAVSSHAGLTAEERAAAGIRDTLVRVSVGIESADDLVDDFFSALNA
ncbi:MAG: PLP-dependent transferase [Thermoanaerobaculia bacterium]|nr:PLP-dependent transferase [Thermoanaerobaculia bacterium]